MQQPFTPAWKTFAGALIVLAGVVAIRLFEQQSIGPLLGVFGDRTFRIWTEPMIHFGELSVSLGSVVKTIVFLIALIVVSRLGRRLIRSRILSRTNIDPGLRYALEVGIGYLIVVLGLIIGAQSVGLNLSSLAFLTGIIGVGVGFGLQNIVNNFVSGLILLMERPVKVGDRVEVDNLTGDIVRIAARSTWVRTNDNVVIIVPNSDFISNRVTNWTANDRCVRIRVPLGVSYSADPAAVRDLLVSIARSQPDILPDPAPDVIFLGFGDSSLDFELRVWTEALVRTPLILKSNLYFAIFKAFAEHGIEIPFPQRDLHLRSIAPGLRSAPLTTV